MYCSVPVFLAHRPGGHVRLLPQRPGWAQIRAAPGSSTWTAEVASGSSTTSSPMPDPARRDRAAHRPDRRIELPPRWALGYHQSHWGYDSAAKVRHVAGEFERRRLPCDVIHLDIAYMDGHRVFTWDRARFPDPAGAGRRPRRRDALRDDRRSRRQGGARERGLRRRCPPTTRSSATPPASTSPATCGRGPCVFPDFLRRRRARWWGDLHGVLVDAGVAGIWNDMNEPAIYDDPVGTDIVASVVEMPGDAVQGPPAPPARHADVHNLYGLSMARARARRCPGCARTPVRSPSPVRASPGSSATPPCGPATTRRRGSTCGCPADAVQPRPVRSPVRRRRHRRVLGRRHARAVRPLDPGRRAVPVDARSLAHAEPPERAVGVRRRRSRRSPARRYACATSLRPYLYTLFHEAATTGSPILRPLLWAFSDDPRAAAVEDEVLLGDALLAAPVCAPRTDRARRLTSRWGAGTTGGPGPFTTGRPRSSSMLRSIGCRCSDAAARSSPFRPRRGRPADDSAVTLGCSPARATAIYDDDGESFAYRGGACLARYRIAGEDRRRTGVTAISPSRRG